MIRYQFWQHSKSGDVYAVRLDGDTVLDVSAAINRRDILADPDPSNYELSSEDAAWFNDHADDYKLAYTQEA